MATNKKHMLEGVSSIACLFHSQQSSQASLHAFSLPIPSPSKNQLTCFSYELLGGPFGLLNSRLSSAETILEAGLTTGKCATCQCSLSWHSWTKLITCTNPVSPCSCWFDSHSNNTLIILQRQLASKASRCLSKSVTMSHSHTMRRSTSN